MSEFSVRVATPEDATVLTALANQYSFHNLDETQRQAGFLTGSFSVPAVRAMLVSVPGQLAYAGPNLAGFVLNSKLPTEHYPPLVQQIVGVLPSLEYKHRPLTQYRWFFYGPALVTTEFRGQNLLGQLFAASKQQLREQFEVGVAFIAEHNTSSLHVHTHKLSLEVVGRIVFEGVGYVLLVFSLA